MSSEDLGDHGRRIAILESKVSELYKRLGQAEPLGGGFGGGFAGDAGPGDDAAADPRIIEAIQAGQEIQAIKLYRELTGLGLAESKEAVDKLKDMYRPTE